MRARLLTITGLVQGVFFRAESQKKAQELGVTGWVRNTGDGGVEIHAEGLDDQLNAFEEWCATGPSRARVRSVATEQTAPQNFTSFEIRS